MAHGQRGAESCGAGRHGGLGLTAVGLVRLVLAVVVAIASPARVDALAAAAGELRGGGADIGGGRGPQNRAAAPLGLLVRAVVTVELAVADPAPWDAGAVVAAAAELAGPAVRVITTKLIAAIAAVVVAIAYEHGGQAGAVAAPELVRGAHCAGQRASRPAGPSQQRQCPLADPAAGALTPSSGPE